VTSLRALTRLKGVGPLVYVVGFSTLAQFVTYTTWVLHNTFKFGWGPFENGISLAVVGVVSVLVQGVLLGRLLKRKDRLDAILIETTGLANPAPVAQTFFTDDEMRANFRLDAVVTLVDAKHILLHLGDSDEAQKQVAFADVILLNKTDLVPAAELDALEDRIRHINAVAKIHRTQNAAIPLDKVVGVGGFNLSRATDLDPQFLEPEMPFEWAGAYPLPAGTHTLAIGEFDHDHHAPHAHAEGHACCCGHHHDHDEAHECCGGHGHDHDHGHGHEHGHGGCGCGGAH
jgi:G3E family GTPase